jgi:alpha-D-ribose 1-methylphosphonate 5-triphosphate synthase subunit PhnH
MLSEVEVMRLVALTKGDEELSPDDKAILIKTYVLQTGQLPKQRAPGVEGKLAQFLRNSTPKAGASEPKQNRKQYKDLFEWARANQEKFPGIKLLHSALSPETSQTKAEAKTKNNQELVKYAKSVDLTPAQIEMLNEVEKMRLAALTKGDEELSPDDKAILIKAYVLQNGQLPKQRAPGAEGMLAVFLKSSTPKAGESESRNNKEQYQDLLKWAETYQNISSAIKALYDRLRPKQD